MGYLEYKMNLEQIAQDNMILKFRVGSHLYGTHTPESDADYLGVFIPTEEYVLGMKKCEQVELRTNPASSGRRNNQNDVDTVLYSLPKYLKLLADNNPNIIETLFIPASNTLVCTSLGRQILDNKNLFVSKKAKHTFLGYAFGQKKLLLSKRERHSAFQEVYSKVCDFESKGITHLVEPLVIPSALREDQRWGHFEKGQEVTQVKRSLEDSIGEYGNRVKSIQKYGFDTKFASHLIRLLDEGVQLLVEQKLDFPLPQNNIVRDIKIGKYTLDQVLGFVDHKEQLVEAAYLQSTLPVTADMDRIEQLQIKLLKAHWYGGQE